MKRALVTGASEGIGRAFAIRLAKEGYKVSLVARSESRLKEVLGELKGDSHKVMPLDLCRKDQTNLLVEHMENHPYDLLVNNAGSGLFGPFAQLAVEDLMGMVELNIVALTRLSHGFLKNARKGDSLINVSSLLGFTSCPSQGVYGATKAYVTSLTEALWFEQRKKGVFVMALCPGGTKSRFMERSGMGHIYTPDYVMQDASQVVDGCLEHLEKRRSPIIVTGVVNKIMRVFWGLMPRKLNLKMLDLSLQNHK